MTKKEEFIINPECKLSEVIEAFPESESKLESLSEKINKMKATSFYSNLLKNTTLRQLAQIENMDVSDLINEMRKEVGQKISENESNEEPQWLKKENIAVSYDPTDDLNKGIHPVQKVSEEMGNLEEGKIYQLITGFVPFPLIEAMKNKGYKVYSKKVENQIRTFIKK